MVLSGRNLPQTSRHGRLHSARLLPCASSFSEEVVEGNHHIMAEGTGLEPYSPCQGLVRGQGGLQDVQPALICRSISQSHIRQTNTLPTLSRRRAPHTGQVLLVQAGLTLMTGTPARAALYSIRR